MKQEPWGASPRIPVLQGGEHVNFEKHVMPFVEVDQVLIAFQVGQEKLRYLTGVALAFMRDEQNKIHELKTDLNDIYAMAAQQFKVDSGNINIAEY